MRYALTLCDGPEPASNGWDLGSPESPVGWADLPADVQATLTACGFTGEHPETWCLVTAGSEETGLPYPPHGFTESG